MINKEALEYMHDLGRDEEKTVEVGGYTYSHMPLKRILLPSVETLKLTSLNSLVTYLKGNMDEWSRHLAIHIVDHRTVRLISSLNDDFTRDIIIEVNAVIPDQIRYGSFYTTEDFNIILQSRFQRTDDRDLLLKFTGLIKEDKVKTTGDDGISQAVTIKTGITSIGNAVVPNPVTLAPFRTFLELDQPESRFIFRMKDGPEAALFEADGGAWKLEAVNLIAKHLQEQLPEIEILA